MGRWIETNVRLPPGIAAVPGPIKLYPYQRGIAEAIADPQIERVTVLKSARIGYTAVMTAALAHFVVREPSPILVLMPTEADCRDYMVSDIEPLFLDSPTLRDALPMPHPGRSDRNTLLHRLFDGGSLKIVAGKAPRNLRRHTARVLMIDEADAIEVSAEGDPITLAEKRTLSFADRKIIVGSTPLDEGTSHIARLYAQSDQRVWEMPCPQCGAFHEIKWTDIEWPDGKPECAAWRCPNCKALIEEKHKPQMLKRGRWRAERPEAGASHAGFRINALASLLPNATWGKLAAEFLRAKDDSDTLRVFVNTVLGQPWREQADEIDEDAMAATAEPFGLDAIPREVLALTCGVDCQGDRLEAVVIGWSREGIAYVLAHEVLWGGPADAEGWRALDDLLRATWRHPLGGKLKIDACCVDGGDGGHLRDVQAFTGPRLGKRVFAIKGASGFARLPIVRAKTKGAVLFVVGSDGIKSRIFAALGKGRRIRFSNTLPPEFYEQLCSEVRRVRIVRGKPVIRFERIPGRQAEALDAVCYGFAARAAFNLNLDLRADDLRRAPDAPPPAPRPAIIRSQWMQRQHVRRILPPGHLLG